ncbi:MAG: prepilin-type N-terminal cleavage/methylation domain-containing protein [Synechococcaceae cyanobacterium RL_1_2]|nr:prepilin-type N-terminal cleavage/methylation domain-containing protein [Synechococcaceae cyanobacterium RL_1_2]
MFTPRYLIDLQSPQEDGFTLIEILMVVVIIAVLSAISLPSFLNQANKARQAEALTNIGAMNKAQQAHFVEKFEFTTDLSRLSLGISPGNGNYTYTIQAVDVKKRSVT